MFQENKIFWHSFRQALLMMVDAIERGLGISPTTSQIRDAYKSAKVVRMTEKKSSETVV